MSDAPERIWAWKDSEYDATLWNAHGDDRYTPLSATSYVRADRILELEADNALLREALVGLNDEAMRVGRVLEGDNLHFPVKLLMVLENARAALDLTNE